MFKYKILIFSIMINGFWPIFSSTSVIELKATTIIRKNKKSEKQLLKKELKNLTKGFIDKISFENFEKAIEICMKLSYFDQAILYVDKVLKQAKQSDELEKFELLKADINFKNGNLEKAKEFYEIFVDKYPGSKSAQYANYNLIIANYNMLFDHDRDQSPTLTTIQLAQKFLENDIYSKEYKTHVSEIKIACYQLLCKSETSICEFFIKRGQFDVCQKRIAYIQENLLPKNLEFNSELKKVKYKLAVAKGDKEQIQILANYSEKFSKSPIVRF